MMPYLASWNGLPTLDTRRNAPGEPPQLARVRLGLDLWLPAARMLMQEHPPLCCSCRSQHCCDYYRPEPGSRWQLTSQHSA